MITLRDSLAECRASGCHRRLPRQTKVFEVHLKGSCDADGARETGFIQPGLHAGNLILPDPGEASERLLGQAQAKPMLTDAVGGSVTAW